MYVLQCTLYVCRNVHQPPFSPPPPKKSIGQNPLVLKNLYPSKKIRDCDSTADKI